MLVAETRHRGEPPNVKCNHVSARSMEIFRRLGVAGALREAGLPADYPNDVSYRTSFTGDELSRIPITYVDGKVHTNGLENFWSLTKRALKGTYVSVEPFHLFRYLDEQSFRFNERSRDDAGRFDLAIRGIVGKRLTYDALTGKDEKPPSLAQPF